MGLYRGSNFQVLPEVWDPQRSMRDPTVLGLEHAQLSAETLAETLLMISAPQTDAQALE